MVNTVINTVIYLGAAVAALVLLWVGFSTAPAFTALAVLVAGLAAAVGRD